ncbi:MAG: type VI secretion system baseplate subunit TssF [bacterium]
MFSKHYQRQLRNLRDLASEFAQAHPATAPLLGKASPDPDVERLLEGVAFLNALIQERLEDEFPQIIHSLIDNLFPHYLRPLPATAIVQFRPKAGMVETLTVPAGAQLSSVPVEGTECFFRTCFATEIHPLQITAADFQKNATSPNLIRLSLKLNGLNLSKWAPKNLRFFPGESLEESLNLFYTLTRHVQAIHVKPKAEGSAFRLPSDALKPIGLDLDNTLLPYPTQSFSGFRLLQEYFHFPQKYLFLELSGWEQWRDRGKGQEFEVIFELSPHHPQITKLTSKQFHLFTAPIVNIFRLEAEPVVRDHRTEKLRIQPSVSNPHHYAIYSVEKVVGIERGSVRKRQYAPIELYAAHQQNDAVYQLIHALSPIDNSPELFLTFPYVRDVSQLQSETLCITLQCTNGQLPEKLRPGSIHGRTADLPELIEATNILTPTSFISPPLGDGVLWKFLSHLNLNFSHLIQTNNLKTLLRLYSLSDSREREKVTANLKRIDGIKSISVKMVDRLFEGAMIRGRKISIAVNQDHFDFGWGDIYLFGSVMGLFLSTVSSINVFTELEVKDELSGETLLWKPRLGQRRLI